MKHLVSLLLLITGSAFAQNPETLGYYLDKGAKPLTVEQVRKIYIGRTMSGTSQTGESRYELTYSADGTFGGTVQQTASPHSISRSQGTWTVDADGKFCINETLIDWNIKHVNCLYFYTTGEAIFFTKSNTDRDSRAYFKKR